MKKNEWFPMATTLCWRCPTVYKMADSECPCCHATNANLDFDKAKREMAEDDEAKEFENVD